MRDEVLLGNKISDLMKDKNFWYSQASDLRKELEILKGQMVDIQHDNDRLEHNYLEQLNRAKLVDKWIKAYNEHIDTEEETEFIHVFRRILIEHHMESRRESGTE